jgi:hypothetical protein
MTVNGGATVTLEGCVFIDNRAAIRNDTSEYFEFEEATIAQPQDTVIRLYDCNFLHTGHAVGLTADLTSENQTYGEALVIDGPYEDYLIVSHTTIYEHDDHGNVTEYVTERHTVDAATVPAARRGIDRTSAWFQRVQQVRLHCACPLATFISIL